MKLLISAYACIPNRGSEPGNGWHWTFENAKLGHEVWCFTTLDGKEAIDKELPKHPHLKIHMVYITTPTWVNKMYRFQPFVYVHYLVWQRRAYKEALRLDKQHDFNLVLHVTLGSFQLGSGMWRLNKPFIFGPVGGGNFPPKAFKKYFASGWKMEVARKWVSDLLLFFNRDIIKTAKRADLVLAANRDTYQIAKRMGARRIELLLDAGLPLDFFPASIPVHTDRKVLKLLWVGRIFPRKGLPLVLEALAQVDVPFHLTILGNGTLGHLVPGWLKEFNLEEKATWHGQVPWAEVKKAYTEHHVFVFCSLRDSFGFQFLEAMAYGLPIIALNHQGAGDYIPNDAGIKVNVTTPEQTVKEIAAAVTYMYHHPDECTRFSQSGNAYAQSEEWSHKIQRMAAYYPEVTK